MTHSAELAVLKTRVFLIHSVQPNRPGQVMMQNNVGLGAIFAEKVVSFISNICAHTVHLILNRQ
jgi:hypothetical protein